MKPNCQMLQYSCKIRICYEGISSDTHCKTNAGTATAPADDGRENLYGLQTLQTDSFEQSAAAD